MSDYDDKGRPYWHCICPFCGEREAVLFGDGLSRTCRVCGARWDEFITMGRFIEPRCSRRMQESPIAGVHQPDFHLGAGGGSHARQTARIMTAFEDVCLEHRPDMVLVVGDVDSTLACSIVAKKLKIAVAHVEAGLRSFDLDMPEEINRMVTDAISDYFFVTEEEGEANLLREGKDPNRVHFVGHVMICVQSRSSFGRIRIFNCSRTF